MKSLNLCKLIMYSCKYVVIEVIMKNIIIKKCNCNDYNVVDSLASRPHVVGRTAVPPSRA